MIYIRFLIFLSIAALAGCDATSDPPEDTSSDPPEETSCSLTPDPDEVNYLPLEVGDEWVFDYEYEDRYHLMPSRERRSGTLTWTVESVGECEGDRQPYTIAETLQGTTRDYVNGDLHSEGSFRRSRTIELEVFGDSAYVPYVDEPVVRFGPSSGPDTLRYTGFEPLCVGSCTRGTSVWYTYLTMVAGSGVVSRSFYGPYRVSSSNSEGIVRRDTSSSPRAGSVGRE